MHATDFFKISRSYLKKQKDKDFSGSPVVTTPPTTAGVTVFDPWSREIRSYMLQGVAG